MLVPAWLSMSAQAVFTADFNSGSLPKDITVSNATGALPLTNCYRRGYTADGWVVDRFGSKGYVALSPTHTEADASCRNILTLPALTVQEGNILRWQARSIYPDFPDSFSVEAYNPATGLRRTLMAVEEVPGEWTTYMASLEEAGEDVEISFICDSRDGYMLGIDDIYVGTPELPMPVVTSRPEVYYSTGDFKERVGDEGLVPVELSFRNFGAGLGEDALIWKVNGKQLETAAPTVLIPLGEEYRALQMIPAEVDTPVEYSLSWIHGAEENLIYSGTLFVSDYKRRLVVDEATGMWCTNCPDGAIDLRNTRSSFGDDMIPLVTHQGDALEESSYWASLKFYALPYFKLDRISQSAFSSTKNFNLFYWQPTLFGIDVTGLHYSEDGVLQADLNVAVSDRQEVAEGQFGVGYVVTSDFDGRPDWYQKNGSTRVTSDEYYYLPTRIPGDLVKFHNVTLTSEYAFAPVPGSIPAGTDATGHDVSVSIPRPELLESWDKARLTVFVLDTASGEIMNAESVDVGNFTPGSSVGTLAVSDCAPTIILNSNATLTVSLPEKGDVKVEAYSADGRLLLAEKLHAGSEKKATTSAALPAGTAIVRATAQCGTASRKLMVR